MKKRGANYTKKRFFKSYEVEDSRIITGQNPWSPREVAKILVENYKKIIKIFKVWFSKLFL